MFKFRLLFLLGLLALNASFTDESIAYDSNKKHHKTQKMHINDHKIKHAVHSVEDDHKHAAKSKHKHDHKHKHNTSKKPV